MPLRPSGSSRMVEASQLETAVAARSSLSPAGLRGEKGEIHNAECPSAPPQIRVYVLIYGTRIIRRHTVMDLYTATRTRSLPVLHVYIYSAAVC